MIIIDEAIKHFSQGKDGVRKEEIRNLLESLKSKNVGFADKNSFENWANSWIIPRLFKLIPELKKFKEDAVQEVSD